MLPRITLAIMASIISVSAFAKNPAKLKLTDDEGKKHSITLDANGTPRLDGRKNSYPTIKDFREDSDWASYCYSGTKPAVKKLMEGLVEAANGDGDSWASLDSIDTDKNGQVTVTVTIEDESGENEEEYRFDRCE